MANDDESCREPNLFRLDLSGCFVEYDEEDGDDEVEDDFDHDGCPVGCGVCIRGRQ